MEQEKKSNGAMIGLVIIIILLLVGGIYVWQSNTKVSVPSEAVTSEDSAELNTLEANLQTTDTNIGVDVDEVK
jgi:beta-lactam-binding protein with PASTA domain